MPVDQYQNTLARRLSDHMRIDDLCDDLQMYPKGGEKHLCHQLLSTNFVKPSMKVADYLDVPDIQLQFCFKVFFVLKRK